MLSPLTLTLRPWGNPAQIAAGATTAYPAMQWQDGTPLQWQDGSNIQWLIIFSLLLLQQLPA